MDPFVATYALTLALVLIGMIGAAAWCVLTPRPPVRASGLTDAEWAERMRVLDEFFSESRAGQ